MPHTVATALLSDPMPRPPQCYAPRTAPHRDAGGAVHLYDFPTIRGLLRDPRRVTSDVTDMLGSAERARLHPVSSFVWATDRMTVGGCPGRHAALRSAMAPWLAAREAERRRPTQLVHDLLAALQDGPPVDLYHDYAMPVVVSYMSGWLGIDPADVRYAIDDQLAAGEFFTDWPMLASPEMDERYRDMMRRARPGGVAAAARDLVGTGVLTEREAWGIVYAMPVSSVATATTIALATGLAIEHGSWPQLADPGVARGAIEEAIRFGNPFPQASRFAREAFTVGEVSVRPGDQVLMWLTAANRDLPGPHRSPLDVFDPGRDNRQHVGFGSGYHLCGGVHHVRTVASAAVTALAERHPGLELAGSWTRLVGIDDSYAAAPVADPRVGSPRRRP